MAESTCDKFRKLLAELFMFDRADLDSGIYRIMNAKRDEVTRFFDNDLPPRVKTTLGEVDSGQRLQLQVELEEAENAAGLAGFSPDDSPRVQDPRQALTAGGTSEVDFEARRLVSQTPGPPGCIQKIVRRALGSRVALV